MSSHALFIVDLESSVYLRRRQWRRHMVVMCHIACSFHSGGVLKFDQFYHSNFFQTKIRLISS